MSSLKQQIEKNTINAHVPQIATIRVQTLLTLLADCVCIPRKQLEEPKVSKKIMHWLTNNEELPLKVKAEMIIGLYTKELLEEL